MPINPPRGAVFSWLFSVGRPLWTQCIGTLAAAMNSGAMRIYSRGHFQVKNEKKKKRQKNPNISHFGDKYFTVTHLLSPYLGGQVEEFLGKDIGYLIPNKKEAKFAQTIGRIASVPSPECAYTAQSASPHPTHDGSSIVSRFSVFEQRKIIGCKRYQGL